MKTVIKILFFTLVLIGLLGIKGASAKDEYSRVIRKEFQVNPDAQLTIVNKFGKVQCTDWDRNSISFEVTITVAARNQQEADRMLERIKIGLTGDASQVSATTDIGEGKPRNSGPFSIDYVVNCPVTVSLDLTNKFGDIFINEIQGKTKIDLGYGNLEAKKLSNSDNLLEVKFGKARINWMKGAVAILKYSEMDLDYAGSLRLDSKFSDLDAAKIIALNMVFEGGNMKMENSSVVDTRSKFSDLRIGRIEQSLNLDIQYGNCDVHEMPAGFSFVTIHNKYGDVSIGIDEQAKYILEADMKFCELDYPSERAKFTFRSTTNTTKAFRGTIGGTESSASKITVHSEFGNVSLQ